MFWVFPNPNLNQRVLF